MDNVTIPGFYKVQQVMDIVGKGFSKDAYIFVRTEAEPLVFQRQVKGLYIYKDIDVADRVGYFNNQTVWVDNNYTAGGKLTNEYRIFDINRVQEADWDKYLEQCFFRTQLYLTNHVAKKDIRKFPFDSSTINGEELTLVSEIDIIAAARTGNPIPGVFKTLSLKSKEMLVCPF